MHLRLFVAMVISKDANARGAADTIDAEFGQCRDDYRRYPSVVVVLLVVSTVVCERKYTRKR